MTEPGLPGYAEREFHTLDPITDPASFPCEDPNRFSVKLVGRTAFPETDAVYERKREDGGTDTVRFDQEDTVPYRVLGAQPALFGTVQADGELVGDLQYREQSSLLVGQSAETGLFHPVAGAKTIGPFTHFSLGMSRQAVWEVFTRADAVHSIRAPDFETGEVTELVTSDGVGLEDKFGCFTHDACLTIDGVQCKFEAGTIRVAADSFADIEPVLSIVEDARLRGLISSGYELARGNNDGSLEIRKRGSDSGPETDNDSRSGPLQKLTGLLTPS